jgi:hypothetical protein
MVANGGVFGGQGTVVRVDPNTGVRTLIAQADGNIFNPAAIAVEGDPIAVSAPIAGTAVAPPITALQPAVFAPPPFAAKFEITRAEILTAARRLSVLAPITSHASGTVKASFEAAGVTERFTANVDARKRRVRINRLIPQRQARLRTGILTLTYAGDGDTQPQEIRLRAASHQAGLEANRPKITGDRLTATGEISALAAGVIRLQVLYEPAGEPTRTLDFTAPITHGRYAFDVHLPEDVLTGIAQRSGVVHSYTLFTGYFPKRVRGEMRSYEVLGYR